MSTVKQPSWTVLYNTRGDGEWIGRALEFYDDQAKALARYHTLLQQDLVPTCRPFHFATDSSSLNVLQAAALEMARYYAIHLPECKFGGDCVPKCRLFPF